LTDPELAVPTLQVIHDQRLQSLAGPVTKLTESIDARIRLYAARAGSVVDRSFQPRVVYRSVLDDDAADEDLRVEALQILYADAKPTPEVLAGLLAHVRGPKPKLRTEAERLLAGHGTAVIPLMAELLKESQVTHRLSAVRVLRTINRRDTTDMLLSVLKKDGDAAVR